jgi:transcription initiation factor TFIIB
MKEKKTQMKQKNKQENNTQKRPKAKSGCPECNGNVKSTPKGESVCEDCGLVVDMDTVDHGPEWRAYTTQEKEDKKRVGRPTTETLHDKGLSTKIGWQNKDAHGNRLNSKKKQQLNRLRRWDNWSKAQGSKDKNLRQALGEIKRMASALGLGTQVRETASVMYKQCLENDLLPGRSIEAVASACLYAASRQCKTPRSLDEIESVSRIGKRSSKEDTYNTGISNTYRYITRELNLTLKPVSPKKYLNRQISELNVEKDINIERKAKDIIDAGKRQGVTTGKSPTSIAAGAIYAACKCLNTKTTQREVAKAANVSKVTIRNRYKELLEATHNHD